MSASATRVLFPYAAPFLLKGCLLLVMAAAWMLSEGVVRDVAKILGGEANIAWFTMEAENLESIHNHRA